MNNNNNNNQNNKDNQKYERHFLIQQLLKKKGNNYKCNFNRNIVNNISNMTRPRNNINSNNNTEK